MEGVVAVTREVLISDSNWADSYHVPLGETTIAACGRSCDADYERVTEDEARDQGYEPCERCSWDTEVEDDERVVADGGDPPLDEPIDAARAEQLLARGEPDDEHLEGRRLRGTAEYPSGETRIDDVVIGWAEIGSRPILKTVPLDSGAVRSIPVEDLDIHSLSAQLDDWRETFYTDDPDVADHGLATDGGHRYGMCVGCGEKRRLDDGQRCPECNAVAQDAEALAEAALGPDRLAADGGER